MEIKDIEMMNEQQHTEEWENAPEINQAEFEEIIDRLYYLIHGMPRNAVRKHYKDVKISEYKKMLNL